MITSWTLRYPSLKTHDWIEEIKITDNTPCLHVETCYKCTICKYKVWINTLGFAKDHRGVRSGSNNYSFYTCNDLLVKDIIE